MKTRRVAFYGKGGIGKSTIASNVSALLAMQGKKVLHIGCDPKADSTRLLCKERIKTVLEVLEEKDYPERDDLVYRSESGVWCVESGGPEAGNGCAGMGIITAMKELERLGVLEEDYNLSFREEIRVMAVSAEDVATPANSYKPYQAYLFYGNYPLARSIYALLNDPRSGLPWGFASFMTSDKGQRIILKSGLVPATQPVRIVHVKDE